MFWSDLASCHYARETQNWLQEHNISFAPKNENPPNLTQARPIEDFWAHLAREVYFVGWTAQNEDKLRRRMLTKCRRINFVTAQTLMRGARTKLRLVEEHGPIHTLK